MAMADCVHHMKLKVILIVNLNIEQIKKKCNILIKE